MTKYESHWELDNAEDCHEPITVRWSAFSISLGVIVGLFIVGMFVL